MAWSRYQVFLAVLMVASGSINTIAAKWADVLKAPGRDGSVRPFVHPFLQACCMFFGEMLCLAAFKILYAYYSKRNDGSEDSQTLTKGNRDFNPFVLMLPAMCDMTATSVMYIGLNLTYPSSFQMLRGSVIVFVGLLSVAFLERILKKREWIGIFSVILGLTIVGLADFVTKDTNDDMAKNKNDIVTGDLLIITAQIITAFQMVIEEKYVSGLDIPSLQAVGWEGVFGFVVLSSLLVPFYYIPIGYPFSDNSRGVLEDAIEAFVQLAGNWRLIFSLGGTILSIAFFNFAGISVTKEMSATTRMVMDSVRTIFVWAFSLSFFDQRFHWLQLLGFVALIYGMCLYNGITCKGVILRIRNSVNAMRYRRMEEDPIQNSTAEDPTSVEA